MVTKEREKQIILMAEGDWMDDYRVGQIKLMNINEIEIYGLNDEELKIYVNAYNAMMN